MKAYFWPTADTDRLDWLHNWNTNISPALKTKYGLNAMDMAKLVAAEVLLQYFIDMATCLASVGESNTAFKEQFYLDASEQVLPIPTLPAPPTWPSTALDDGDWPTDIGGIVARIATSMKAHANYDPADGQLLRIVGADVPPPNPATTVPELSGMPGNGGKPLLRVKMVPFHSWELWGDFGSGTFTKVDTLMRARYQVTHDLPAPGVGAVWKFKAIFRMGDEQFGQWSPVLEFAVRG